MAGDLTQTWAFAYALAGLALYATRCRTGRFGVSRVGVAVALVAIGVAWVWP